MVTKNIVHSLAMFQWNTKNTIIKGIEHRECTMSSLSLIKLIKNFILS